jgi:hypothetical protein
MKNYLPVRLVVFGLAALALVSQAEAQIVPIKISGSGVGPQGLPLPGQPPRAHTVAGKATHLGRHEGAGTVQTDEAIPDLANGRIIGFFRSGSPFVFTAANGDQLVCHYGNTAAEFPARERGRFELSILKALPSGELVVRAYWIAEFVPQSNLCTGRFTGVSGSWIMYAKSDPFVLGSTDPVHYSWEGEGRLKLARP